MTFSARSVSRRRHMVKRNGIRGSQVPPPDLK